MPSLAYARDLSRLAQSYATSSIPSLGQVDAQVQGFVQKSICPIFQMLPGGCVWTVVLLLGGIFALVKGVGG